MPAENKINLTIVIPGLYVFTPEELQELAPQLPRLQVLSELQRKSRLSKRDVSGYESMLCARFGLPSLAPIPVAELTFRYDKGRPPENSVLRIDPVYLKADRDCLYLLGHLGLQVSLEEAQRLATEINLLYEDTPWSLEIGSAERWYLCSDAAPDIKTCSLEKVFGKNIAAFLPQGAEGKQWRALLNELQMVLHNSAVNVQRENERRLPINSVWLWGEGRMPPLTANRSNSHDLVWSDEAFCRGLAQWAQCANETLPAAPRELIERLRPGRYLLVFDDMRLLAREDFAVWANKLAELEENWLVLLREAVDNKKIQLTMEFENGLVFESGQTNWRKWWTKQRLWYEWN